MIVIVTCPRRFEHEAAGEACRMLEGAGLARPSVSMPAMPGIVVLRVGSDPVEAVAAMARSVSDEPWAARYVQRAIPVQAEVPASVPDIAAAAVRLWGGSDAPYRVTVEKRHTQLSARAIISEIAGALGGRVSLDSPELVVLVQIIGPDAGVSVIRPGDILRTARAKLSDDC